MAVLTFFVFVVGYILSTEGIVERFQYGKIIAILSLCEKNTSQSNITTKIETARMFHKTAQISISAKCLLRCRNWKENELRYQHYDVCESEDKVVKAAIDLLLGQEFYVKRRVTVHYTHSKVVIVLTVLPEKLNRILIGLLAGTDYRVILYAQDEKLIRIDFPMKRLTTFGYEVTYFQYNLWAMKTLLNKFGWNSFGLINLENNVDSYYSLLCQRLTEDLINAKKHCFFKEELRIEDKEKLNGVIQRIHHSYTKAILLFGLPEDQIEFLRHYKKKMSHLIYDPIRWILQSTPTDTVLGTLGYVLIVKSLFKVHLDRIATKMHEIPELDYLVKAENISLIQKHKQHQLIYLFAQIKMAFFNTQPNISYMIRRSNFAYRSAKYPNEITTSEIKGLENHEETKLFQRQYQSPPIENPKENCLRLPHCPVGWQSTHDRIKHTRWNLSFGKTCKKCDLNTIKAYSGLGKCRPCKTLFIPNWNRSACIDPFIFESIRSRFSLSILIALVFSFLGTLACLIIFMVILKNRQTPIGKALDIHITFFHLTTLILIFVSFPITTIVQEPNKRMCSIQAYIIGTAYTLNVSSLFVRSNKILSIFNKSFTKMTKTTLLKTLFQQAFSIISLTMVYNLILYVVSTKKPSQIISEVNIVKFQRTIYCNNDFQFFFEAVYNTLCHLLCAIPAYRGRKLPCVFNEAIMIVYTSFVCVISFGVMFPIHVFQKNPLNKITVVWIVHLINSFIILILIYGLKCYLIVWKSHKNTKIYFRSKIQDKMLRSNDSND